MIKYKIKTGDKTENAKARAIRDQVYKKLKNMRCGCGGGDTIIDFIINNDGYVKGQIIACCDEFEFRIRKKLN